MTEYIQNDQLLDEVSIFTLTDISCACYQQVEWVIELVDEGIIEPCEVETTEMCFSGHSFQRALIVKRLQQDLSVNLAGAALALELIDEIKDLRTQLSLLQAY
jgi:chaperone modulatory protein CbpM